MTIEIILAPVEGPVLRGDALGGVLMRGWAGPAVHEGRPCVVVSSYGDADDCVAIATLTRRAQQPTMAHNLRLDCRRREVKNNIVDVLAAGERCDECGGHGADGGDPCVGCRGSCYTRAPIHLGHITDAERCGALPAEVAAWWLWVSVLRADAGLGPVGGVAAPWGGPWAQYAHVRHMLHPRGFSFACVERRPGRYGGWSVRAGEYMRGDEDGDAGMLAADRAALAAGYILDNGDHLLLPHPAGVVRVELEAS